jgi:hypothetical protein
MEIKISKSARACHATERAFEHGETIHSLIRIENGALIREDYSSEAWKPEYSRNAYSVWTSSFYDPQVAEQEPPEVFSPLRQLFYEAVEADDRRELAKAYLAAQLLRRQKVFRRMRETEEGENENRLILYADRIGNRLIEVRDPNFSYQELEAGRQALMERLQELEAPEKDEEDNGESGEELNVSCEAEAEAGDGEEGEDDVDDEDITFAENGEDRDSDDESGEEEE